MDKDDDDFLDLSENLPELPDRPNNARGRKVPKTTPKTKSLPHYAEFLRPVGVTFIAHITGRQPYQVQKRLSKCPIQRVQSNGAPLYDFMEAMSYLVPPKGDVEQWFSQQNQASLPPLVSKAYWDSTNARIRAMMKAGDLWHTDDVVAHNGRVLMQFKSAVGNWVERLPEKEALTDAQYNKIVDLQNELIKEVREALMESAASFQTHSMAHTIKAEIEEGGLGSSPYDDSYEDE